MKLADFACRIKSKSSSLSRQAMLSLAPYIHVTLHNLPTAIKAYEEDGKIPDSNEKRTEFIESVAARFCRPNVKFICKVTNETAKLAIAVRVYVFEIKSKTFFRANWGRTELREKDSIELDISLDAVSLAVIVQDLQRTYGNNMSFFERQVNTDVDESYVIVFFRDVAGNAYAVRRRFTIDAEGLITGKINELILRED